MGNQAFGGYVARVTAAAHVRPAALAVARDPDPDAAELVKERHRTIAQSLIGDPLTAAAEQLRGAAAPDPRLYTSIARRLKAAREAFSALRFPGDSIPGKRVMIAQAELDVAIAMAEAEASKHPEQLVRMHFGRSLGQCQTLSKTLPKPTEDEPEDKRAVMRNAVCPAITAAIMDLPPIVRDEATVDDWNGFVAAHASVPEQIHAVAGDKASSPPWSSSPGSRSSACGRCHPRSAPRRSRP